MTPLLGAGLSIMILCGLLMLRVPMLVSVAGAAFLNFYLSGAWALTMPQTIMSGLGRFAAFCAGGRVDERRWHFRPVI